VSLLVAIFLLSFAALLFQFAQTRLLSVMLDYHLTFFVVSGALLGVAAGGTAAAVVDERPRRPSSAQLAVSAAVAAIVALFAEARLDPIAAGMFTAATVAYVVGVVPVVLVSWIIVRALRSAPQSSGMLYAADLAGAATGGAAGYLLIGRLGDQGLFGLVAAGSLLAAGLLLAPGPRRARVRTVLTGGAIASVASLSIWGESLAPPLPGPFKVIEMAEPHEVAQWDPLARIDVIRRGANGDPAHYAFLIDANYAGPRAPSLQMTLDMGAQTPIIAAANDAELAAFDASVLAVPYEVAPRRSVLVVGPGGGIDIVTALRRGASAVTAVEVNRAEVALMRGRYASYSGGLYLDPRVRVFEDEARTFVRRSSERYDVISITVVDSFAALSAGAYALTENYLYTEEAMLDYIEHLSPDGVVAISRWYRDPPVEIERTFGIADAALRRLGQGDPVRSVAVLRYRNLGLVLVRATPFAPSEIERLQRFAQAHEFVVVHDPLSPSGGLTATREQGSPTDDRPFFFDTVPLQDLIGGRAALPYGYLVLLVTLVVSLGMAALLALLPLYRQARRAGGRILPPGTIVALCLGAGFIAAELVLLQRLTLYLGQPSLALSVGLAALLGGAACGSGLSARWRAPLRTAAVLSAASLLVVLVLIPVVSAATLAAPLPVRLVVGAIAAAAVGLPLGTVFPKLIATLAHPTLVSWSWAANGTFSVLGASLGTFIAITGGFSALGWVAIGCYLIAALFAPRPASST
jgi:hypothetical protein